MERIAPSATLEAQIAELLSRGIDDNDQLAEIGRLGTRLVLQRAVEDEMTAFLRRARYERAPMANGSRNGSRNKPVQTAEGELTIAMPQVRGTVERFVSRVIPDVRGIVRTRPLEALVIGAYVRGLSNRDIESLLEEAGLGHLSKNTASRLCRELRGRYAAFCAKSLADVHLLALFLGAVYLPTRPSGAKEGVLVVWGYRLDGERVLLAVRLGQRESREDWLDLGRDLTRRGLRCPWLVVSDGAPGLIAAIEEVWPSVDRGRCAVHKLRKCWPSCRNATPSYASRSSVRAGRRSRRRPIRLMPRVGCARWSATRSGTIRVQRRAWPMICQLFAFTCTTCRGCASGSGHRTCWSDRSKKCAVGRR